MKKLETDYFIISYEDDLEDFIQNSLKLFDNRLKLLKNIFKEKLKELDKTECAFFTERKDFENYIKKISNGQTPPSLAKGCFYNDGIQVIVDKNFSRELIKRQNTLIHEFTHTCINNLIYIPFHIPRVRWLDESFACYVDGHLDKFSDDEFKIGCENIKKYFSEFDMNYLDDIKNVNKMADASYQMFDIIGKYIFENNLQEKYLNLLKTDEKQIRKIGCSILEKSIKYFENSTKQKESLTKI